MIRVRAGAATDVGRVRSINQDCLLVTDTLWAVADGMGGHAAGDVAARVAVDTLQERFDSGGGSSGLVSAIRAANSAVFERARADAGLRGMGTTLTVVADVSADGGGDELVVANVGDSRAYILQNHELSQLTADHSLVEELVRAGELTPREAAGHPQRHIVTRALGIDPDIEVDTWTLAPHPGDRFLVCSDGLSNEVDDDGLTRVLRDEPDAQAAADRLIEMARSHGGTDNITAIVLDVLGVDAGAAASPGAADGDGGPSDASPPTEAFAAPVQPGVAPAVGGPAVDPPAVDPPTLLTPAVDAPPVAPARGPVPAPRVDDLIAPAPGPAPAAATRQRSRRFTFRVALFLIALLVVIGGAAAAVVWYARNSYFVGLQSGQLVIFQGRPGGLLGLNPTPVQYTGVTTSQVPPTSVTDLRKGMAESSRTTARHYVCNLVSEYNQAQAAQGGTTAPMPAWCPVVSGP